NPLLVDHPAPPHDLPSFPTRRSSDLGEWKVVLGSQLARSLGVGVGDRVTLLVPEASITPAGVFPRLKRFTVSGIFSVGADLDGRDRKSTRLNSSHVSISYAVFCLKKK